jgi:hypothetical protein
MEALMKHVINHITSGCIILLLLAGCSDGNPLAVDNDSETPAAYTLAGPKAAKADKMVPLKGRWVAQANLEKPFIPCPDPEGNPTEIALPSEFNAQGQVTHLGRTQTVIRGEWCEFDPSAGTITAAGRAVHTGANGDAIYAAYQNVTSIADGTFASQNIQFVDGTGRFKGVTGYAASQGTINLNQFTASFSIEGKITPVGANRKHP